MGVGYIESYSQTPIANAKGTTKCVVSKAVMTGEFLLREYISNGLEITPYFDGRCQLYELSPPLVLVRVSSLTATTTNYVDRPEARTSSAKKALPSNSLSPPTAPQTESPRPDNRPTTVLASPPPRKSADVPSITPSFASSEPVHSDLLGLVPSVTTLIATGNGKAESAPSEPVYLNPNLLGSVPPAATLIATGDRETERLPLKPIHSGSLGPVPLAITRLATGNREAEAVPSEPIHSGSLGFVPPAITLKATGDHDAESPTKTRTPDQPQELGNINPASRPGGEPIAWPVFETTETVALSSNSSPYPIGSSSTVNPTNSFPTSEGRIRLVVTDSTSLGLPGIISSNKHRPTTLLPPLPSIQTFTNPQEFTVPNPSHFILSGTTEIHRGGSTIITSGTRFISLGNSATIIIVADDDDSSKTTTPVLSAAHTTVIGTWSQEVPGTTQAITTNNTSGLPPPAANASAPARNNRSEVFPGGETKLAEVPMLIMFGATFLGIAAPWGLLLR